MELSKPLHDSLLHTKDQLFPNLFIPQPRKRLFSTTTSMAIVASPVPLPLSTAYSVDHELYNHLATLEDANAALNASKATHQIFSKIASLLSSFGQEWGLVLVHGHCTLQPNEKMVHRGRVAEPEIVREGTTVFPTRWMSDGKPFEYTPGYTKSPTPELLAKFQEACGDLKGVLGLYYADTLSNSPETVLIEHSEERKNILEPCPRVNSAGNIQTAWYPDGDGGFPVQMACVIICDSRTTRNGGVHKGTKSHLTTSERSDMVF